MELWIPYEGELANRFRAQGLSWDLAPRTYTYRRLRLELLEDLLLREDALRASEASLHFLYWSSLVRRLAKGEIPELEVAYKAREGFLQLLNPEYTPPKVQGPEDLMEQAKQVANVGGWDQTLEIVPASDMPALPAHMRG